MRARARTSDAGEFSFSAVEIGRKAQQLYVYVRMCVVLVAVQRCNSPVI